MKNVTVQLIGCLSLLISMNSYGQNSDWTQWRGPSANGSSPETDWNPRELLEEDVILWQTNVGMGHSSVAVKDDNIYTFGNKEIEAGVFKDFIACLDVNNGEEKWEYSYSCAEGEDPGPLSTLLIDEDRCYSVSREGHFLCLDALNGELLWQRNVVDEKLADAGFGVIASPIVYKDFVILNIGKQGVAFNKFNGKIVWKSEAGKDNFSTPVLYERYDEAYLIFQTADDTYAVNPETGKAIWHIPKGSIPDPIVYEDKMLHFTHSGVSLYHLNDKPEELWIKDIKFSFQSYVKNDNYVYGFGGHGTTNLQCISLEDGEVSWNGKIREGALIIANDVLIVIGNKGKLSLIEASPEAFHIIAEKQIFDMPKTDTKGRGYRRESACWTNPVLSHGKLYVRNTYGDLVCLNL